MKAHEKIRAAMRHNEDWVLAQIARFGSWYPHTLLGLAEHNALQRLLDHGAIKYSRARRGYVRAGTWAPTPGKTGQNAGQK